PCQLTHVRGILSNNAAWGGALRLMTASSRRCTPCGRGSRTHRRDLAIYQSDAHSWEITSQSLCRCCAPRLARAARYGGALRAPNGRLIIDFVPEPAALAIALGEVEPSAANDMPTRVPPVAVAVWVVCLILIVAFGALATFTSPLFFLGVLVPFVPLAALAGRSS